MVAYASKILSKTERNYSKTEREALAIYWGCKQFHPYLHNNYFWVVTDHNLLVWLKSASENVPKLMRWSMKINSYNFDIFYKSGKKHSNAEAMSRLNFSVVNTTSTREWRSQQIYLHSNAYSGATRHGLPLSIILKRSTPTAREKKRFAVRNGFGGGKLKLYH